MKICKQCGKEFEGNWAKTRESEFCSRSCSNTYASRLKRAEINKKVSEKMTGTTFINGKRVDKIDYYNQHPKHCLICGNILSYKQRKRKTCSKECHKKQFAESFRKNPYAKIAGGMKDRGGRGKSGWWNGYYCASTYELVFTIYNLDHGISFERNKQSFPYEWKGKKHLYYPDYIIDGKFYEVKGYWSELVDIKAAAVPGGVTVLYEDDLKYCFNYVSEKYLNGGDQFQILYEKADFKRRIKHCEYCGKEFEILSGQDSRKRFCDTRCAARFRHGINDFKPLVKDIIKICEWCGNEFKPGYNKKTRFCSSSCAAYQQHNLRLNQNSFIIR